MQFRSLALFFFIVTCPSFLLVNAADETVSASLKITDGDRPLTLYEAPSTGRRDARGRRVKSIIIVSKNPATESRDKSNDVAPWSAPSSPAATTATPVEKITIPFFSISCSVGSSCSQIISARDTKTARPTFRPYTKEEIAKFKGPLSSLFPPKIQTNVFTTTRSPEGVGSSAPTTTAHPWKLQTWTLAESATEPTAKPVSKTSVWRIRTTTPKPAYVTTTAAPSVKPITLKPFTISSHFQFGPTTTTTPRSSTTTTTPTITEAPKRKVWSTFESKPVKNYYSPLSKPAVSDSWSQWPVKTNSESRTRPTWVNGRPVYDYSATAEKTPIKTNSFKFPEFQTWSLPSQKENYNNYRPTWSQNKDTAAIQLKPHPQENFQANPNPATWKPRPQETFYTNPKTNSKVALITAASATRGPPVPARLPLPAEVSVSSAVVGLRVAPKSLSEPAFIERVNGHLIETDGRDDNLSALIMQHELPRPPRARMLHYNQPRRNDNRQQQRQLERRYNYHGRDAWQPIIFPRI